MLCYSRSLVTYKLKETCVHIKTQTHRGKPSKVSFQPVGKAVSTGSGWALSGGRAERSEGCRGGLRTPERRGGSAGSDLCRPSDCGGARGAQGWARPPRVSVGWETRSSRSKQAPMKLDLDSFQLQISYL